MVGNLSTHNYITCTNFSAATELRLMRKMWITNCQAGDRGRVAQWLRCCATNWKVAGSIPAGFSGFFIDIKSFRSHYGPEVDSASNRNEYREHFLEVKAAGAKDWQPYHHPVPLSCNLGTLNSWNSVGHSRPVMGLIYRFTFRSFLTILRPTYNNTRYSRCILIYYTFL